MMYHLQVAVTELVSVTSYNLFMQIMRPLS